MKNSIKALAVAGLIGLAGCNTTEVTKNDERVAADTANSLQFAPALADIIEQDTSVQRKMNMIYGHPYSYPVLNEQMKKHLHDNLLKSTAGFSPIDVRNIIIADRDIQKILSKKKIIGNQELMIYIEDILLQAKLFYEGSAGKGSNSLIPIDSIVNQPVDKAIFEPLFGSDFAMKNIDVAYVSTISMREGTSEHNTVILNSLVTGESVLSNRLFTEKSNLQTYTKAVINNEVLHTYLRQKYGKLTDAQIPLGHIIFNGNPEAVTILDVAEYLSDVTSVNTDITYFSTPLSLYITDVMTGVKTFEHYKMSKIMTSSILRSVCNNHPELNDTLTKILEKGKKEYQDNINNGADQNFTLHALGMSGVEYLKAFYSMMTPEIENEIKEMMNGYGKSLLEDLDKVKKAIDGVKKNS